MSSQTEALVVLAFMVTAIVLFIRRFDNKNYIPPSDALQSSLVAFKEKHKGKCDG